ncbi:putative aldouronate transport system permease protein [Paenibacillus sp. V4I9]|uniref:carbohydrate ABC transporter permease n=1 Tax=Paenibacillus sp. V4I9 TaxID=3042308 RepID=UPI002789AB9E|nr:carbohydrate ABC transporter permease [Paenibacillus sp. V4I9]MDQ0886359.1 putative aldouronate transport system permease protein [Paenibacillus sp. V4I9]
MQGLVQKKTADRLFDISLYVILILIGIATLYPFINVLAISFNDSADTVKGGIHVWPRVLTIRNYETIFQYEGLLTGFRNSTIRTVLGTMVGVLSASMVAYVLSKTEFQARRLFTAIFVMTLYISGGLIPGYMLIRDLHLLGTFWVYIIPGILSVWNVLIVRSYINGLPYALLESAKMDGANDWTIFWRVILPLCQPVLATIALFIAVNHWNSWFDTYLYNGQKPEYTTLQYELRKVLLTTDNGGNIYDPNKQQSLAEVSPESIQMAITMVVTAPILLVYPFLQKYFVKGITLGAVKS